MIGLRTNPRAVFDSFSNKLISLVLLALVVDKQEMGERLALLCSSGYVQPRFHRDEVALPEL